jgi:hypothetical protein
MWLGDVHDIDAEPPLEHTKPERDNNDAKLFSPPSIKRDV